MSDQKKKLVYKKLTAHNTIWHPESTLVFKSQKERLVIGRLQDSEIVYLDEQSLELCDQWNFKPDESLIHEESEESDKIGDTPDVTEKDEGDDEDEKDGDERDDEEEDEKTDENVKKPIRVGSISGAQEILLLTNNFSIELSRLATDLAKELGISQEENVTLNDSLNKVQEENVTLNDSLNKVQGDYDAINKKFETMKSLFN